MRVKVLGFFNPSFCGRERICNNDKWGVGMRLRCEQLSGLSLANEDTFALMNNLRWIMMKISNLILLMELYLQSDSISNFFKTNNSFKF